MFCSVLLEKMFINKNLGVYSVADYVQSNNNSPKRFQNLY